MARVISIFQITCHCCGLDGCDASFFVLGVGCVENFKWQTKMKTNYLAL